LKPGGVFAATFMEGSKGYTVGDTFFPAVSIHMADVADSMASVAYDVKIRSITTGASPVREGYSGMILAMGRAAG
jgi:hypothetical protein